MVSRKEKSKADEEEVRSLLSMKGTKGWTSSSGDEEVAIEEGKKEPVGIGFEVVETSSAAG